MPRSSVAAAGADPAAAFFSSAFQTGFSACPESATMAAPNHDGDDVIPELRGAYNSGYTAERYREYSLRLAERAGVPIPFRLAETPVFLPPELRDEMVEASRAIFRPS